MKKKKKKVARFTKGEKYQCSSNGTGGKDRDIPRESDGRRSETQEMDACAFFRCTAPDGTFCYDLYPVQISQLV